MSNAVVARPASNASPPAGALGPHLARASGLLWREVQAMHADGQLRRVALPLERALTLYLDKQELVTLMTLGQWPELLVLGYLLNQGLIADAQALHSISVDWETQAAAVSS